MVKVKMEDIDKLGDITVKLGVLSYLNELILSEIDADILHSKEWVIRKDAADFVQENLNETFSELREIMLREDFIVSTK